MYGVGYADIVVSHHLAKYLVIEVKSVAATDGRYLYAADVRDGGLIDRIMVDLSSPGAPVELWNLSVYGIYRAPSGSVGTVPVLADALTEQEQVEVLLHPRYKLPASCFAYVPDASRPTTWKLPYLLADGAVDPRRLPMAIQAILGNYRGTRVGGIPETDMQAVLIRLARAAWSEGRMPLRALAPAPTYQQLALVLDQLGLSAQMADTGS